jgi:hypothetical protein
MAASTVDITRVRYHVQGVVRLRRAKLRDREYYRSL